MKISILRTPHPQPLPDAGALGFGRHFADHMFLWDYDREDGWHNPRIEPIHDLGVGPGNLTIHYGQTIFEGLKSFRWNDGSVILFRPQDHVERFRRSARRLCMPDFNPDDLLDAFNALVDIDRRWVPSERGTALYLRPTLIASDDALGVRPSHSYTLFIVTSPVGAYYSRGSAPTRPTSSPRSRTSNPDLRSRTAGRRRLGGSTTTSRPASRSSAASAASAGCTSWSCTATTWSRWTTPASAGPR